MSEKRKTYPNECYFITLTIEGWVDLFTREVYKEILVSNLEYCQQKEGLEIYTYVIMSNHLHMICLRRDKDLTELIGRFKSFTAKKFLAEIKSNPKESRRDWLLCTFAQFAKNSKQYSDYHVWQYTNHPTGLYSNKVMEQKEDYIHLNPVRAGLVTDASTYYYSSACPRSPLKVIR